MRERILEFLGKDPGNAYTVFEIYAALENYDTVTVNVAMITMPAEQRRELTRKHEQALEQLRQEGKVAEAVVQGQRHYAIAT